LTGDCRANYAEHLVGLRFVKAGQNMAHIHKLPSCSVTHYYFDIRNATSNFTIIPSTFKVAGKIKKKLK